MRPASEAGRRVVVALTAAGAVCCAAAWLGTIFGPRSLLWLGAIGFLLAVGAAYLTKGVDPALDEATRSEPRRRALGNAVRVLVLVAAAAGIVLFAVARLDGVADFPALERRPVYQLNNHGELKTVSRARYVVMSASFGTAWCGMALAFNLHYLYRARYGRFLL